MQELFQTDSSIFVIDGRNCTNKQNLIQEFSKIFHFPDYIENNWDSFDEVINDLTWIKDNNLLVYIKYFDSLLNESPKERETLFSILSTVSEETFKTINWIKD